MEKSEIKNLIIEGHYKPESVKKLMLNMLKDNKIEELLDHIAMMSNVRMTELIITHNENIARSLKWFIINRLWVNLCQILRSLPEDIKNATKERSKTEEEIKDFAEDVEAFLALGKDDRKKCLDTITPK